MRKFIFPVVFILALSSCKNTTEPKVESAAAVEAAPFSDYTLFGEKFDTENVLRPEEMNSKYKNLAIGDTLAVAFETTVNTVCKKKGCWMTLDLKGEEDVMVKFRDYGFFVPKHIENRKVVVRGLAYMTEVSVEEQRHFAEDGGKSPQEIMRITEPKKTLSFLADGVLIAP